MNMKNNIIETHNHNFHHLLPNKKILVTGCSEAQFELVQMLFFEFSSSEIHLDWIDGMEGVIANASCCQYDAGIVFNYTLNRQEIRLILHAVWCTPFVVISHSEDILFGFEALKAGAQDYLSSAFFSMPTLVRSILFSIARYQETQNIQILSSEDSLTRLLTRHAFFTKFDMLLGQSDRNSTKLALAVIDLNKFRTINDTYGYKVGDFILEELGNRIRKNLRKSDLAARFGGDEFILLITNYHNQNELFKITKRALNTLTSPVSNSMLGNEQNVILEVNIGVAEWKRNIDAGSLLLRADEAMHHSKQKGTNFITVR